MKIDATTINVLKNFATINNSIVINIGNKLETVSSTKTVKATAKVLTSFPRRFAMYNLSRFISTISLFNDPDVEFGDNALTISDGDRSVQLTYSDESTIIKVPDRNIVIPKVDVSVKLTNENLKAVEKALGVLSVPEIIFTGKNGKVYIQAADSKNPSGDFYSIEIGEAFSDFRAIFKSENIKILPGDYTVDISSKGISKFYNDEVEYFITVEQSSSF
jgi:gp45 sliding clamp, C terminal